MPIFDKKEMKRLKKEDPATFKKRKERARDAYRQQRMDEQKVENPMQDTHGGCQVNST